MPTTVTKTSLDHFPVRRGKVRDIYDLGDTLLLVSTDRISAFDWVLPSGIPDKGRVLTQLSRFWFEFFKDVPNHMISCEIEDFDLPAGIDGARKLAAHFIESLRQLAQLIVRADWNLLRKIAFRDRVRGLRQLPDGTSQCTREKDAQQQGNDSPDQCAIK